MPNYSSIIGPNEYRIDDSTDPFSLDLRAPVIGGEQMSRGYEARDWDAEPYGTYAAEFTLPIIPRSEWADRIEHMERTKTRLSDIHRAAGMKSKSQAGTNYCWAFAAISAIQSARAVQGGEFVELSPASVGAPIKNYKNVGGWSTQAIRYLAEHGVAPTSTWPDTGINRKYDNEGSRRERKKYKVTEWWELRPRSEDELMTCLLSRIPVAVGFNWWGHAVEAVDPLVEGGSRFGYRILNSWSKSWGDEGYGTLFGSKRLADDGVAPRVVTPTV